MTFNTNECVIHVTLLTALLLYTTPKPMSESVIYGKTRVDFTHTVRLLEICNAAK